MQGNMKEFWQDQNLKTCRPEKPVMDAINACRKKASQLYDVTTKKKPAVIFSNDGTGFGKSYGVINAFIEGVKAGHRQGEAFNNLIFITPQKSQIDFSSELVEKAHQKEIEFVSFLARADLVNLEFESWVPGYDGGKRINRERYQNWIGRGLKDRTLARELGYLKDAIKDIDNINRRIKDEKVNGDDNLDFLDDLQEQLFNQQLRLEKVIEKVALAAFNPNGAAISLKEVMFATGGINALRKEIICHTVPFAMAMVKPCIMLATTNKFDRTISLPVKDKKSHFYFKRLPFDCILGGKKALSENNAGRHAHLLHSDQLDFLKTEFFASDEANFFKTNDISFTLIIDEEHEAHKIFAASASVQLITADTQLAHVFAVVNRVLLQIDNLEKDEIGEVPFYLEKLDFIKNIKKQLSERCELSPHLDLGTILSVFAGNIDFVQIKSGDVEQVINITRNVFSFTPKRYFNEQGLKRIRIKPSYGLGACQLYYTTSDDDINPSLHDVYQTTMAVLYAAAKIKSSSEFLKSLKQGGDNSQNYLLFKFICRARKVASEVEHMFERMDDENLQINHFFTYFQPKTVFSIERLKKLEFQDESLTRLTYVNFTLDLLKEQPEVSMLRMLYGTQNTIICLSATSGFAGNITGQYNRSFLKKYCSGGEGNLGIEVITRTENDATILADLRNNRSKLREVAYYPFDVNGSVLNEVQHDPEFQSQYKIWHKNLIDFARSLNTTYQRREFDRQLTAVLLAAYDAKHTLSLSLSGRFMGALIRYLKAMSNKERPKLKTLNVLEEKCRIFEITPFKNNVTIRVILFNAQLARECDVRQYTQVDRTNLKIVFVSHYRGAGTGLNYFVSYSDAMGNGEIHEDDFERLILINGPFWSDIIQDPKSDDRTLHSLGNYLNLMKRYSDSREIKLLKDFDVNLVYGDDYRFLMREHSLELFKIVMQAIGRVERKDANLKTEIFLPDELIDNAMVQFAWLQRNPANKIVLESMSLLNYHLMEFCENKRNLCSFSNDNEREAFEHYIEDSGEILEDFYEEIVPSIIEKARTGNSDAIEFNEALRHIESITNPQGYVERLKLNSFVRGDSYIFEAVERIFLDMSGKKQAIKLCRSEANPHLLTDVAHGDSLYEPERQIVLDYSSKMDFTSNSLVLELIRKNHDVVGDKVFKNFVPHPKSLAMLKGNMGEYLFSQLLNIMAVKPFTSDEVISKIGARAYELFDIYLEVNDILLCIDVKNWSSTLDKQEMAARTHNKALGKIETILSHVGNKYQKVRFAYINTRFEYNPLNIEQEVNQDGAVYYLNLLMEISGYQEKRPRYSDDGEQIGYQGSQLKSEIVVNRQLIKLIRGEI